MEVNLINNRCAHIAGALSVGTFETCFHRVSSEKYFSVFESSEKAFYQPRGMNGIYEWNKVAIEHLFKQASIERERLTFDRIFLHKNSINLSYLFLPFIHSTLIKCKQRWLNEIHFYE